MTVLACVLLIKQKSRCIHIYLDNSTTPIVIEAHKGLGCVGGKPVPSLMEGTVGDGKSPRDVEACLGVYTCRIAPRFGTCWVFACPSANGHGYWHGHGFLGRRACWSEHSSDEHWYGYTAVGY